MLSPHREDLFVLSPECGLATSIALGFSAAVRGCPFLYFHVPAYTTMHWLFGVYRAKQLHMEVKGRQGQCTATLGSLCVPIACHIFS